MEGLFEKHRKRYVYDREQGKVVEVPYERRAVKHHPKWPITPDACALEHPSLIESAKEYAKKHGCPTDYTPDGRPIIRSLNHYRKYCRVFNYYFRNDYSCGPNVFDKDAELKKTAEAIVDVLCSNIGVR